MTQSELNRAVSRATGEDFGLVAQRGFNLVDDQAPTSDEEWQELAIDWDELESMWRGRDRLFTA